jgi:hypothetical protein
MVRDGRFRPDGYYRAAHGILRCGDCLYLFSLIVTLMFLK